MEKPNDCSKPFFSYGLFKHNELAYRQIKHLVYKHAEAKVNGKLLIRDGLPIVQLQEGPEEIKGDLIVFIEEKEEEAYSIISNFEPGKHYKWGEEEKHNANILVGKTPKRGSILLEHCEEWSSKNDPIFKEGLLYTKELLKDVQAINFKAPPEYFKWYDFFKLQMCYMFLWTIMERFMSFIYGPSLDPGDKVKKHLAKDEFFQDALKKYVRETHTVYDTRDPEDKYELNFEDPKKSAGFYYQIRCNSTHRGKAAWQDVGRMLYSAETLQLIIEDMLENYRTQTTS